MAFLKKIACLRIRGIFIFSHGILVIIGFLVYFCLFHILMKIKITKKLLGTKKKQHFQALIFKSFSFFIHNKITNMTLDLRNLSH